MDMEIFEEVSIVFDILGDKVKFIKEEMEVSVVIWDGIILDVELFISVVLEIVEIDFGVKGDMVIGGIKLVILEIGV